MRLFKVAVIVVPVLLVLIVGQGVAKQNQFGVSDSYQVNFTDPVRVAGTLLPRGDYEILHTMQGQEHVMVFRQIGTNKPVEVKAKCTLVPLSAKADRSEKLYSVNDAKERVLRELVFKGDTSKHVFE